MNVVSFPSNECGSFPFNVVSIFFSFQNTALHLAAKNGHAQIVKYLLSIREQDVIGNGAYQNALDVALETDQEAVAMTIAEHPR